MSSHRRVVAWGETDAAGIVFYPNYFRWFDEAAHGFFREIGFPVAGMLNAGFAVPLVECSARFLAPLHYGEEIAVETTVGEVRKRAFRLEHVILVGAERVAEGYEVRIWIRLPGRDDRGLQADALPSDLAAALQATVPSD